MGLSVAALFDVHGNLPALEAVLVDVEAEDVDVVVFGGDLVWGPWPSEALDCAEALGERALFVHGNCETLVAEGASRAHAWARDRLDARQLATITEWPMTITLEVEGLGPVLFCHATPRSDDEILTPESAPSRWAEAFAGVRENVVACGHSHVQFDLEVEGVRVINPGSVGAPTARAAAWWAVLGPGVELRTTDYDVEATVAAARVAVPDVRPFARWLLETPSAAERIAELEASA